ncbi:hypothetical protein ACIBO9_22160 [Streptomyces prunicolor]|uniref:hypothetical protein n=1 Tax=Streptomyces prunicolor TaxID=67348 RepID=UPI0037D5211C
MGGAGTGHMDAGHMDAGHMDTGRMGTGHMGVGDIERVDLGEVPYEEAVERMTRWVGQRRAGEIPDRLALLTHPPVITHSARTPPGVTMTSLAEIGAGQGRSAPSEAEAEAEAEAEVRDTVAKALGAA